MTPDEFPNQEPLQDPMTSPAQPGDSDYTPQPLPDVLSGRNRPVSSDYSSDYSSSDYSSSDYSAENVVADPWSSASAESEPAPSAEPGDLENGAIAPGSAPETTPEYEDEAMAPIGEAEREWGDERPASSQDYSTEATAEVEAALVPPETSYDTQEESTPIASDDGAGSGSEDALEDALEDASEDISEGASEVIDLEPIEEDLTEEEAIEQRVMALRREEEALRQRLLNLREEIAQTQSSVGQLVTEGLRELERRRQELQFAVDRLERRQERIQAEMRSTFAGSSQELAVRIQGFKDYLVGSLQDLVTAAEDLRLTPPPAAEPARRPPQERAEPEAPATPEFAAQRYQDASRKIRKLLDQYRTTPDYYGPPWQLRRTFEPIHAERVTNWFFDQGGRGAIRTMGSRLQNVLVASAAISVLHRMYGDRLRALVLSDSPERLGEWRRGLQDCLGLGRMDFGTNQGVTLFDAPEPLAQRADRLLKQKYLPIIIIDESEGVVDLSLLQFPLWMAFAIDPMKPPVVY